MVNRMLRQAYKECAAITKREAKNFYYAFVLLPPTRKRAIYAIYSFCRVVDDAADLAPSADVGRERLLELRVQLDACLAGHPSTPLFIALADATRQYNLQPEHLYAVLDGVEQDLEISRYASFEMLREYCWKVASAVGLLTLEVFGYTNPAAQTYAVDLGLAMQLTNILRDIKEDLNINRVYLPQDELALYGVSETDLANGRVTESFRRFMQFQVQRTRTLFVSGMKLAPLVNWSSRPCPLMLAAVYSRILDQIEEAKYNVFAQRIGPSGKEKVLILFRSWLQCYLALPQPRRG